MSTRNSEREQRDFEALLHPEGLRTTLLGVSLYVLAFEMFRDRVIDHLRILHSNGFDESGWKVDEPSYQADVAIRHKSRFQASLLWFKEHGALGDTDLEDIDRLRTIRNDVVHNLGALLGTPAIGQAGTAFSQLVPLFRKVEIWWIRNFEMEVNPDMAAEEVADDEIQPGSLILLQMLVDTAIGKGDTSWKWFRAFAAAREWLDGANRDATA